MQITIVHLSGGDEFNIINIKEFVCGQVMGAQVILMSLYNNTWLLSLKYNWSICERDNNEVSDPQ